MTKALYAVSPIGLGHASRGAAIGLKLRERGFDLEFATGGAAASFLRSYGFRVHDTVREPTPEESGGVMRRPGVWYLRYWLGYRSTKKRMRALMAELRPDIVVGDEEFSSVSLAIENGTKHALISDELELGFAKGFLSRQVERRVSRWYNDLQRGVAHLLVPDFGVDRDNLHFVEPVVREVDRTREQTLASIGCDPGSSLILFSASGSGIGSFLLEPSVKAFKELGLEDANFVVTGPDMVLTERGVKAAGLERDNQNLVAASDLVISTAGKSTIDEAASSGTPIIAIPIKNHTEQERNARALGFTHEDVGNMKRLIAEKLGKRTEPRNYRGAENAAVFIASL